MLRSNNCFLYNLHIIVSSLILHNSLEVMMEQNEMFKVKEDIMDDEDEVPKDTSYVCFIVILMQFKQLIFTEFYSTARKFED